MSSVFDVIKGFEAESIVHYASGLTKATDADGVSVLIGRDAQGLPWAGVTASSEPGEEIEFLPREEIPSLVAELKALVTAEGSDQVALRAAGSEIFGSDSDC